MKDKFDFAFIETNTDSEIITKYADLMKWANLQTQYSQNARNEFAQVENADPWIIATASVRNFIIVTHEVFDSTIKKKIPIPNVCEDFDIRYIDTFTLLRELNFSFK